MCLKGLLTFLRNLFTFYYVDISNIKKQEKKMQMCSKRNFILLFSAQLYLKTILSNPKAEKVYKVKTA